MAETDVTPTKTADTTTVAAKPPLDKAELKRLATATAANKRTDLAGEELYAYEALHAAINEVLRHSA